jgi:DNA-binding phage protein
MGRLQKAQKWLRGGPVAGTLELNEERPMALTRDFKETVKARADRDPAFREALLTEAVELLITGKVDVGKAVLRDYINATIGFARLAKATGTPSKSLMRMLGPKGNPRANNLLAMIGKLQRVSGVRLAVGTGAKKRAA